VHFLETVESSNRATPGEGVAEEAFMVRFRGGPSEGVAEEDLGAGRRAAAEGC